MSREVLVPVPKGLGIPIRYILALASVGLAPIPISECLPIDDLCSLMDIASGVLLIGGSDVNPLLYGAEADEHTDIPDEERDALELSILEILKANPDYPLLAICRGMQILGVSYGLKLTQHLPSVYPPAIAVQHWKPNSTSDNLQDPAYAHPVYPTSNDSVFADICRTSPYDGYIPDMPSLHHQAPVMNWHTCKENGLVCTGFGPGKNVEVLERKLKRTKKTVQIGVQGHPEANPILAAAFFGLFAQWVAMHDQSSSHESPKKRVSLPARSSLRALSRQLTACHSSTPPSHQHRDVLCEAR